MLVIIALMATAPANVLAGLKVHFIDVGQGDSILVESDGCFMLVDAGPWEAGETVNRYLKDAVPDGTLQAVVATHEHDDHLQGMTNALRGLKVETIYSSRAVPMSYWFQNILPVLNQEGLSIQTPQYGDSFSLGAADIRFVNPLAENENSNNLSLVIRIEYGDTSVLLTADIESDAELAMLEQGVDIHADVLKIAHHGGNTSTSEAFLKAVNPGWAVISVGKGNKHGHPHAEPLNNLARMGITVYRTDLFGTVTAVSDGSEWEFQVSRTR